MAQPQEPVRSADRHDLAVVRISDITARHGGAIDERADHRAHGRHPPTIEGRRPVRSGRLGDVAGRQRLHQEVQCVARMLGLPRDPSRRPRHRPARNPRASHGFRTTALGFPWEPVQEARSHPSPEKSWKRPSTLACGAPIKLLLCKWSVLMTTNLGSSPRKDTEV